MKQDELHEPECLIALSVDPIKSHKDWLRDVVAHCENKIEVKFLSLLTPTALSERPTV
jgi:1-Cys peroxiredoxin 6